MAKTKPSLDDFAWQLIKDMADRQRRLDVKLEEIERFRDQLDPDRRRVLVERLRRSADKLISHADTLERAKPGGGNDGQDN